MSTEAENTPPMQELRRQLDMAQSQLAAYARDFKHTVDELRASEARFRAMVETTSDWIWEADENGVYTYASPKVQDLLGYAPEEVVGRTPFDLMPAEEAQRVAGLFGEIVRNRQPFELLENANLHRDGRVVILESSGVPVFDRSGDFRGYRGIDRDITERKQAERALRRLNRALKTLSACNEVLVRATDETQLLNEMCKQIVETGRYRMAWVGLVECDGEHRIRRAAQAGCTAGFLDTYLAQVKGEGDWCPTIRAVRTGTVQIVEDISADSTFPHWREEVLRLGVLSCLVLPLLQDSQVLGSLTLYSAEAATFSKDELDLLMELAADTSFGISTLRTRRERDQAIVERQQHLNRLRKSLEDSIQAIAATVEMRDPYTAGHQRRVASLAVAIARGMGLPEEQIAGLHLAGIVHDLGKINVPSEILSKPGRLSEIEFMLIKTHPQAGYEILKEVEFPWPIAQIVLQHHERLDGSGYPQGLKGGDILPEARILAVADVVEAMASHRPYRPGKGIDAALEEITRNRGMVYDPDAVDACVKLFRVDGFTFS